MPRSLGGWIHSFTVTDAVTHKDGYTIYKITSIVFPRAIPEALTCITVWKRFHEIKKLYRDLSKRKKLLQLRGHVPEPNKIKNSYFKRFDPEVIELRKSYILQLLDFAAQHPALYKSHSFLNFFENGHTPQQSPTHRLYHYYQQQYNKKQENVDGDEHERDPKQQQNNIETICDNLDLTYDNEINLIDPSKDSEIEEEPDQEKKKASHNNDHGTEEGTIRGQIVEYSNGIESVKTAAADSTTSNRILNTAISFDGDGGDNDYIYEAAYEFSQAVQAEVNQEYRIAYEKYKLGIDKLLTGSKDDLNDERKFIAKAKVTKYMSRADELYEKYLLNVEDNKKTLQLSIDITDTSKEIYLERPWNQLSKFKVIQIIDESVMQVQDVTDKCLYIMKSIEKPSSNSISSLQSSITITRSIFLPQDVPYMVQLLGFFQSDTSIYLLLRQAKGGKLFDHIHTYTPTGHVTKSLNEIFTEITSFNDDNENFDTTREEIHGRNSNSGDNNKENNLKIEKINCIKDSSTSLSSMMLNNYDSGFIELLSEYKNCNSDKIVSETSSSFACTSATLTTTAENTFNDVKNDSLSLEIENENCSDIQNKYEDYVPSFDILSEDMDVSDLVSCSQRLLKSVSNTLEQFKETKIYDNNNKLILDKVDKVIENDNSEDEKEKSKLEKNDKTISSDKIIQSMQSSITSLPIELHTNKHRTVLPEVSIKQWARELVTAIDSLHLKGVILGDLRPDNLLLGSKGQLLLSYFYQSEGVDYNPHNYLNLNAIENLYVAPERPLTMKSDCWSFGVILFELLTGYSFKLCHPGNLLCYYEIQYPDNIELSSVAKDLLDQTIQYNAEYRLNIDGIKMHKFFEGTQWNDVIKHGINSY